MTIPPKIKILVATHKAYPVPTDKCYLPIHVGKTSANITIPIIQTDNIGNNISIKNPVFCELTALYWAWKNLDADYIGLVHYRRHFKNPKNPNNRNKTIFTSNHLNDMQWFNTKKNNKINSKLQRILKQDQAETLLRSTDVILPRKQNYYIENLYEHYCKTMYPEPLIKAREIITKQCPDYLPEFDNLKHRTSAHMFNMFVMKKNILNDYCTWLFPILFELESQIDTTDWSNFQKRYIGRVSERLLDVWINTNHISYKELPFICIEPVNWIKKGSGFLCAKFFRRQYEKSW